MKILKTRSGLSWLIAGVLTATCAFSALAQQSVTFTSPDDAFKLNNTATGTVSRTGPFLTVRLDQHVMWHGDKYVEPTDVIGFKVSVAGHNEKGRWEPGRSSGLVPSAYRIRRGESKQLPPSTFLIPIDGLSSLSDKWLVLTMVIKHGAGEGFTYAHSDKLKVEMLR
ncbi:hypothetical protein [Comamonas sp. JNW]|uniref:hypothetical protein n=1 Tax=Comamonas sp. JNW TaxID=2170731 RepID=UPI000DE6ED65|nr:hypothetical protein [Comamonas sp. JNW]PWB21305.1 hypothetical protein DCO45_02605 [Comamonas sp. JNW]